MRDRAILLLTGVPLLVLAASFGCIAVRNQSWWPWRLIVHEDGQRRLLRTIFYFEHALGELPLEWVLALACAGAVLAFQPPAARFLHFGWIAGLVALSTDAIIAVGSWFTVGTDSALNWLLQYHTRDEAPLVFGSHWRYHLLSEAMLMLWAALLVSIVAIEKLWAKSPRRNWLWKASWLLFVLLSLAFGINADPFRDARTLGHQARESFAHALVTIPLACGVCLAVAQSNIAAGARRISKTTMLLAAGCFALGIYQVLGVLLSGSRQQAQTNDWTRLVCAHFFEHSFSYAVTATHALWFYLVLGRRNEAQV